MTHDPYYCLSCGYQGAIKGIISITSTCERCDSLLILPLANAYMLNIDDLSLSVPKLIAEESQYRKWRGKKHLRVVPDDALAVPNTGSMVPKNVTDGGGNEEA